MSSFDSPPQDVQNGAAVDSCLLYGKILRRFSERFSNIAESFRTLRMTLVANIFLCFVGFLSMIDIFVGTAVVLETDEGILQHRGLFLVLALSQYFIKRFPSFLKICSICSDTKYAITRERRIARGWG